MKLILIGMLLASQVVCNRGNPDRAHTICKNDGYECTTYTIDNKLTVYFWSRTYSYLNRQSAITFMCEVRNETGSPLLFDRRNYSIRSNREEYVLEPARKATSSEFVFFKDTLRIPPGSKINVPVFQFLSKNKMSHLEYKQLIANDTVSFEYARSNQKDTIFRLYGIPGGESNDNEK
jgi:hypothetical protein